MKISWYPGHMHKARKELASTLRSASAVIEILDARAPQASTNPILTELRDGIPSLVLLNKSDLANPETTAAWHRFYSERDHKRCIATGPDKQKLGTDLIQQLHQLVPVATGAKVHRNQVVVLGVPNVGKSTVINALAERKIASTGNEPAVTRAQQQVKLGNDWLLIDTPGMMWPNLEDQRAALCLAMLGSIRQTALELSEIGLLAVELINAVAPDALAKRYQLDLDLADTEQLVTAIARKTGAITRGNQVNWHAAAETVLNDFRSGKLGRLSLESPPGLTDPDD